MPTKLDILVFMDNGRLFYRPITQKSISIGRSHTNNILLTHPSVSRHHASLHISNDSLWIMDGDLPGEPSTNGVYVNQTKITVHQLTPGEVITFGKDCHAIYLSATNDTCPIESLSHVVRLLTQFMLESQGENGQLVQGDLDERAIEPTLINLLEDSQLDGLTKLTNRNTFLERVRKVLDFKNKVEHEHQFAIFFIDVDRFKMINDSLGHLAGDQFLIQLAVRISNSIRPNDMAARLGGDEFAIFLDDLKDTNEALTIAQRLQDHLTVPMQVENQDVFPSISIGIALSSLNYQTVEEILRDADTAMYSAKENGRGRFMVFDQDMRKKVIDLLKLHSHIQHAVDQQEFYLNYQPIVSLEGGMIAGFEALIRWHHAERGNISPDIFIPIIEENNLIYSVGYWILEEACRQVATWNKQARQGAELPVFVSVNISPKQLADVGLVDKISDLLESYQIAPGELKLEITENILMDHSDYAISIFKRLREMGVQIVIDDFGTGYSSLSYLHKFPVDALKVDRSFILAMDSDDTNTSFRITQSIIGLAHGLGVKVVAEGIEKSFHAAQLKHLQCDYGQGYLYSKPVSADEALNLLVARSL